MPGGQAIGDLAIGDIEGAIALIQTQCLPGGMGRFIARWLDWAMRARGAERTLFLRERRVSNADDKPANVFAVWAMVKAEDLAPPVQQSDFIVYVAASNLAGVGLDLPLKKGDRLVRWPDIPGREHVFTTLETPALYTVGVTDVIYKLLVRGG